MMPLGEMFGFALRVAIHTASIWMPYLAVAIAIALPIGVLLWTRIRNSN